MADQASDWLSAVSCAQGSRSALTFADLPRQHQGEMVRFGLVAAASTAYFIALGILMWPLPSRSLAADAALFHPGAARSAMLDAQLIRPTGDPAPVRPRTTLRSRPVVALASLRVPADGDVLATQAPRRNAFSRFFRGVLRTFQPGRTQADSP